jgi:hypothetical protein
MSKFSKAAACAVAMGLVVASAGTSSAKVSPFVLDVYALGPTANYVAQWTPAGRTWSIIGGAANEIYEGPAGLFETLSDGSDIYAYSGVPNEWTVIGGPGTAFAVGGNNLYGVGLNDAYVAEWNGTNAGWTEVGGPASEIFAGGAGLFAMNSSADLFHYDGTPGQWTYVGTNLGLCKVNDTTIYCLNTSTSDVEQWNASSNTWAVIGGPAADLYAAMNSVYMLDLNSNYDTYDGTPGAWTTIGGANVGYELVANWSGLFDLGGNNAFVGEYSGSGTSWSQIGGPAYQIAAGG